MLRYKKIKIFLAFVILIALSSGSCLTAGGAFAAENDDVYVRKDLFEAYMKNIDSKLDTILKEQSLMREDIKNIDTRLTKLESKVDGIYIALPNRIDGVEKRFDVLFYLVIAFIGLIGVIFGLPVVQRWWEQRREDKSKPFTAEDAEKLFERLLLNAKMNGMLQS